MLLLSTFAGCASVLADYEAARSSALSDPGPAPEGWLPDAVIHLSAPLVDQVVSTAIAKHGHLETRFGAGPVTLAPTLSVTSLELGPGRACADCLSVALRLDGEVAWQAPFLSGTAPVHVDGNLEAAFDVSPQDAGWAVSVRPRDLHDLSVTVGGVGGGLADVDGSIREWLEAGLLAGVPALTLADLGSADLPVRAIRVVPDGRTVQIHVLTAVPSPGQVAIDGPRPNDGWRVDLAWDSLVGLARAEVFRHEPATRGLIPEPRSLALGPDGFTLGLRLWRTDGRGWWRDYEIRGTAAIDGGRLRLEPVGVEELDHSTGAAWADPLAALAEGLILRSIEAAVDQTLPARRVDRVGAVDAVVRMEALEPVAGALRVRGSLELKDPKRRRRRE